VMLCLVPWELNIMVVRSRILTFSFNKSPVGDSSKYRGSCEDDVK
jgi:hypothetical protein